MNTWTSAASFLSDVRNAPFFTRLGPNYVSVALASDARRAMVPDRLSEPALRTTVESTLTPTVEAAAGAYQSRQWTDFRQEVANLLGEAVQRKSVKRYNTEWNKVVSAATSKVVETSREKARAFPTQGRVDDDIAWDLIHACCEIHFRDIVAPGFFTLLSSCYVDGFLPFGWMGEFPEGRLLVCADGLVVGAQKGLRASAGAPDADFSVPQKAVMIGSRRPPRKKIRNAERSSGTPSDKRRKGKGKR